MVAAAEVEASGCQYQKLSLDAALPAFNGESGLRKAAMLCSAFAWP